MSPNLKTIFFDAAGTLIRVRGSIGEAYAHHARRFGFTGRVDVESLGRSFERAFQERQPLLVKVKGESDLRQLEKFWWREVVAETFRPFGRFGRFEEFFESLYEWFGTAGPWLLEPGAGDILERLNRQGYTLGVISNFDSRLTDVLSALRIDRYFQQIVISSVIGAAKPDPAIFRHALSLVKTAARDALHVGDDVKSDVLGAREAGLWAVLYDPLERHPDFSGDRISRFGELFRFLL